MKFEFDKKYFKICLYAFLTVAALLLFQRMLESSKDIWQSLQNVVSFILELLSPFILAIFIAYLLSPAVQVVEMLLGKVMKKERFAKARGLIALITVYLATLAVIALTLAYVIPGIIRNIGELIRHLPDYYRQLESFYNDSVKTHPLFANEFVQSALQKQLAGFNNAVSNSLSGVASGITSFVLRLVSSVAVSILGLVISFYLLNERAHIVAGFERLVDARLENKKATALMNFLKDVDKVFGRYISAKLLLMLIMFVMCFIAFSFLGLRYGLLMSAIVGVTTLVPFLGPYLGAIPPIVIAFLDSPAKGIYTSIVLIIIHQVDNYVFEPYVFSDKMGLSPFWILLSIMVFGGLFGLWGILLAVPIAGIIKILLSRYIRIRQVHKQRQQETNNEGRK